ncbi:MAG: hypothetical protein K0S61_1039 [Anaerocolumna sp.]|jgi:hypothetical protein|nr:hypothetical protein [Anaerocolumna sp.]
MERYLSFLIIPIISYVLMLVLYILVVYCLILAIKALKKYIKKNS